jgi:predicted DNA-binding transcriptional regulator AlpA
MIQKGRTMGQRKLPVQVEPMKRLLTVRDLAARLGESESAIRTRLKRNQIPEDCIMETGRRKIRFDPVKTDQWIESMRRTPKPEVA